MLRRRSPEQVIVAVQETDMLLDQRIVADLLLGSQLQRSTVHVPIQALDLIRETLF